MNLPILTEVPPDRGQTAVTVITHCRARPPARKAEALPYCCKILNFLKIFAVGRARAAALRLAQGGWRQGTAMRRGARPASSGGSPLALTPNGITTCRLNDANAENRCQNDNNWLAEDLLMSREILRFAAHGTIEVDTASRTLRATTKKMLTYFGLNGRKA